MPEIKRAAENGRQDAEERRQFHAGRMSGLQV